MSSNSKHTTLKEITDLGELDFTVTKQPLLARVGQKTIEVDTHRALVRDDTQVPIAVVGKSYGVVQNRELFGNIDEQVHAAMTAKQVQGAKVFNQMSFDGRLCLREYQFPGIKPSKKLADPKADLMFRIVAINGYGGSRVAVVTGAIDVFCLNGMITGEIVGQYFKRHSKNVSVTDISEKVKDAIETFPKMVELYGDWAKKKVSDAKVKTYLEKSGFSNRMQEKLFVQYLKEKDERGGSVWALYSALTYYASHSDDEAFGIRETSRDHEAATMMKRERKVVKQIRGEPFMALAA